MYHPHRLRVAAHEGPFGMHLAASRVRTVTVGTLQYESPVRVEADPFGDSYHVNLAVSGEVMTCYGFQRLPASITHAVVHGPTAPSWLDWRADARILGVKLERAAVETMLTQLSGEVPNAPISFAGGLDLTRPGGREWVTLARRARQWSARASAGDDEGFVARSLADSLAVCLLTAAAHEHTPSLDAAARSGAVAARRALTMLHAAADARLSIAQVAATVGTSARTLEKHFVALWGLSPGDASVEIRLGYARLELQTARAARVGDVASRWGFGHAGRFAARYEARFEETPSQTLAHTRHRTP